MHLDLGQGEERRSLFSLIGITSRTATTEEEGPLDEEIPRRRSDKDREPHPAAPESDDGGEPGRRSDEATAESERLGGTIADETIPARHGEALPDAGTTPPQPGKALPGSPTEAVAHPPSITNAASRPGQRTVELVVVHPSQTRFTCLVCKLTYPTHNSLIRHVTTSHAHLTLNITFKCALCDYTNVKLRGTSNHFAVTHGATVPPDDIDRSTEKACPFCQRTFPSVRSCSTHIRERHMKEASEQRAREAVEKERRRGSSTARTKWGAEEIARFKEALGRLGQGDNTKLAEAVGTRDKYQVAAYKSRFLKANPTWIRDNHHPVQPTANAPSSCRPSTRSPPAPKTAPPLQPNSLPQGAPGQGNSIHRRGT